MPGAATGELSLCKGDLPVAFASLRVPYLVSLFDDFLDAARARIDDHDMVIHHRVTVARPDMILGRHVVKLHADLMTSTRTSSLYRNDGWCCFTINS